MPGWLMSTDKVTLNPVRLKQECFSYGNFDYRICSLLDHNQFDENDHESERLGISSATWPLFGLVWPSARVLVSQIIAMQINGRRVLEIGCGIGLASIVLHRMGTDITASDYHPQVLPFLQRNISQNSLAPIKFQTGNWEADNPLLGQFDIIIGSDVLYEPAHIDHVSRFISQHSSDNVEVLIVDPGRRNRPKFIAAMRSLGFDYRYEKFNELMANDLSCRGWILHFKRGYPYT
jgi:predicted nicotinamide N-methyase